MSDVEDQAVESDGELAGEGAGGKPNDDEVLILQEAPDPDSVLPVWESTGNATVDSALEQLRDLAGSDIGDHAATFERIEQSLRATLNGLAAEDESA